MKKIILMIISVIFVMISSCNNNENDIEVTIKGDFPKKGKAVVYLYGYDKNIPDESTTLITIKKTHINKNPLKLKVQFPENTYKIINSNYFEKEDIEFFITVDIDTDEDLDIDYAQDFDKNPILKVVPGIKKEVLMKKI